MTKAKSKDKLTNVEKFLQSIKETCPPDLYKIIEKEGGGAKAALATGMSNYTISQTAKKIWPVREKVQAKIDAYHRGEKPTKGRLNAKASKTETEESMSENRNPFEAKPPIVIPPWDKKTESFKIVKRDGSKETLKVPTLIGKLFEIHGGVKNAVGRALGYASWNTPENLIASDKYEAKLHARAFCAVNGLPLPGNGNGGGDVEERDKFKLGLALCMIGLNDFDRLEDLAEAFGCTREFKMTAGSTGWWVIYHNSNKEKLEKFKRLAKRDAKKIVCP